MIENVEEVIRGYLPGIIHMSLGTTRDDRPWVCEVHYAYDEDLNLYWVSKANTRHSTDIRDNPRVAGNIVMQHGPGEKPRGVYFEGVATELIGIDTNHAAYTTYVARFGERGEIFDEAADPEGRRYYQIAVDTYYLFDVRESRPPRKYVLPWKK